ncbi:protein EMSY-LIKE 4-like isoform X2 [Pistacia vera]|uniref:protein EMSY-LIKE 4-like isoform X2 n=1 Tax=Pistacia vera TaxID=55513 RepID=UPI001263ABA1|nr:protein EMSY-LIKE 4-like isoform X2 [Pistacia vera]
MAYVNHNPTMAELGGMDEDIKLQIHCMEKEAYSYVLRAFIAQSDLLSWGKEGLITELRKELNVTDTEHGELLLQINSDKSIKMIREWRKGSHHAQEPLYGKVNASSFHPGFAPDSVCNTVPKRMKISHASVAKSQKYVPYSLPTAGMQSRKCVSHIQPSSGTLPSPVPVQFRDDQPNRELAMISSGNPEQSMKIVNHNNQAPSDGKRKVLGKSQSKKGIEIDAPHVKKSSDVIEIHATDKLIHKVERTIYGTKNPNPVQIEKAKLTLREHERTLLDALDKLADVSDDEPPYETQHHYSHKKHPGNGQGMEAHCNLYRQIGGFHGYHSEAFGQTQSVRMGAPFLGVQGDEDTP